MLRARAGRAIIFGLTEENIKRLKDGKPIHVDLKEMGMPMGSLTIFYGPTEDIMETQLMQMLMSDEKPKK